MESVVLASVLLLPPSAQEAVAEALTALLGDVADSRTLLTCERAALLDVIEQWPQNLKKRALEHLKIIYRHHRLVSDDRLPGGPCRERWPAVNGRWDGVIGPAHCRCPGGCDDYGATLWAEYPDSLLYDTIRHSGDCIRAQRTIEPAAFEQVVFRRWFQVTRWVQVVDWYCGWAWGPKWQDNLAWIAGALHDYSPASEPEFQLRTELPPDDPVGVRRAIEETIRKAGCRPVVVPTDKHTAGFPHGRYLQTEQGWWDLGGGIDWKRSHGRMAAVEIRAIGDHDAQKYRQAFPRVSGEALSGGPGSFLPLGGSLPGQDR